MLKMFVKANPLVFLYLLSPSLAFTRRRVAINLSDVFKLLIMLTCCSVGQVNDQLALHMACGRPGASLIHIVQQILRWSQKDCRLTADKVTHARLIRRVPASPSSVSLQKSKVVVLVLQHLMYNNYTCGGITGTDARVGAAVSC